MNKLPDSILAAREQWRWRGEGRPPFAIEPQAGQVSVWDFPRPPRWERESREVSIFWGETEVARSRNAVRLLETAHPPSFYLPWSDVARDLFKRAANTSLCEWKGPAVYWTLDDGERQLPAVAWSYPSPLPGSEALADLLAFYPSRLTCQLDGETVRPQPGGFYGGWVTSELVGPFKGERGSEGW